METQLFSIAPKRLIRSCSPCPFYLLIYFFIMQDRKKRKNKNRCSVSSMSAKKTVTIPLPISNDQGFHVLADYLAEIERMYDLDKNIKNNLYAFLNLENRAVLCIKQGSFISGITNCIEMTKEPVQLI